MVQCGGGFTCVGQPSWKAARETWGSVTLFIMQTVKKKSLGGEHFQVSVLVLITGRRTSGVLSVGESRSVHRLVPNGKVVINNSQWYS